jgi:hypothetical protein
MGETDGMYEYVGVYMDDCFIAAKDHRKLIK